MTKKITRIGIYFKNSRPKGKTVSLLSVQFTPSSFLPTQQLQFRMRLPLVQGEGTQSPVRQQDPGGRWAPEGSSGCEHFVLTGDEYSCKRGWWEQTHSLSAL